MIISEFVEVKTFDNKKIRHYKSLGYDITQTFINVRIEDLPKSVSNLVLVKCDYCDYQGFRHYVDYNRTFKDGKWACSKECGYKKKAETELKKEKVINPNFGKKVDKDILEKRKKTNLEKWGVEYPLQNPKIMEKFKQTNLRKFGVDNFSNSDNFLEKLKKSNNKKWGVDFPTQLEKIKEKTKNTNINKWGVSSTLQLDISKKKRLEKTKSEEFRKRFDISNHDSYIEYLGNSISLFNCDKGHNFKINYDNFKSRLNLGLPLCTVCYPISSLTSIKEKELLAFIQSKYSGEIIHSYRDILEIDIYLPQLKLGFEFNGIWWHSDEYKEKNYHYYKRNHFKKDGIKIINIWEDDWDLKKEIVKSQILNFLGKSNKIPARKCKIKKIDDVQIVKDFMNKNHIQGFVKSNIYLSLLFEDEIVCMMSFDEFEGRKKMKKGEWNLNRFCNKMGISVVGGASKILSHFEKNYHPERVISYSDCNWSNGDLYKKLGFVLVNELKPDYKYVVDGVRIHKSRFRKKRTNISESKLNIPKIFDSGKLKWEKIF